MKNNTSIWSYLFQPFRFIAGRESLIAGVVVLIALALVGYWSYTFLDGVLDVHMGCLDEQASLLTNASCVFISWAVAVLVFFFTAKILSQSAVRLIDMAGTMAVAKYPFLFAVLIGFIPQIHFCANGLNGLDINALLVYMQENWLWMSIGSGIMAITAIWSIFLMYNAYSISGNLKGTKGIVSFIVALFVAEVISKIVLMLI
ncbi:MAG: hypothetical protein LBO74_16725 [Candidatus Symbiothrix sp.]|jgi:hypothetical protein|nr:hypothetical protein [Candidatus Symbiothrix sp.]